MRRMVPDYIASAAIAGLTTGEIEGVTVCVAIRSCNETVQEAISGNSNNASTVSRLVDQLWSEPVSLIRSHGGVVAGFRGDTLTAFFPSETVSIRRVWDIIVSILANPSPSGDAGKASIGLSRGSLAWTVAGPPHHRSFAFYGSPLVRARDAMNRADGGTICLEVSEADALDELGIIYPEAVDGLICLDQELVERFAGASGLAAEGRSLSLIDPETEETNDDIQAVEESFFPQTQLLSPLSAYVGRIAVCVVGMANPAELIDAAGTIVSLSDELDGFMSGMEMAECGGSALIIFGAPLPLDDVDRRAVDFAMMLREAYPRQARVALAAGLAYAGFLGSQHRADYSVLGGILPQANLRFSYADPGQIVAGPEVRDAVGTAYGFQPIVGAEKRKKRIRGKTYTLLWREDLPGGTNALFVGREDELGILREYIAAAPGETAAQVDSKEVRPLALVLGAPGIGKTTLVRTAVSGRPAPSILEITGSDRPQAPFACLNESVGKYWALPTNDDVRFSVDLSARFSSLALRIPDMANHRSLERCRPFIGYSLGEPQPRVASLDPEKRFDAIRVAWATLLRLLPGIRIVIVDDYQWLDGPSTLVLSDWLSGDPSLRALITSRDPLEESTLFEREILSLSLEPLSYTLSRRMLELGGAEHSLKESEIEQLIHRSGGNPFYLEQSIAYIETSTEASAIPRRIEELILNRIDELSVTVREAVRMASVLGRSFDMRILSAMLREEALPEAIRPAQEVGVWKAAADLTLIFSHALVREAVYHSRLEQERQELHAAAARAFENVYTGSARRAHLYEIAEHYERAGMIEEARIYLKEAAGYALEMFDNERAVELYRRRVRLGEPCDLGSIRDLSRALQRVGSWDECTRLLQKSVRTFEADPSSCDPREAADCHYLLGNLMIERGEMTEGLEVVRNGIRVAEGCDYSVGLAYLHRAVGYVAFSRGEYAEALSAYERALDEGDRSGEKEVRARVANNIALVYSQTGRHEDALRIFESNLVVAREENNYEGVSSALNNIGYLYNEMGRYKMALPYFEEDLALSREAADQQGQSIALGNIASILASLGRHEEALPYIEEAIEIDDAIGFLPHKAYYHLQLGSSLKAIGHLNQGCVELAEALRIAQKVAFQSIIDGARKGLAPCEEAP